MADKPNILFFFTDDQRFDTIHALGNPDISTPAIDRLVKRGVAFTHAHIPGGTSGAVCMPSRAMLHSGRTLFHLEGAGESIPAEHITLGETLRQNGYRTFGTGKWHNGAKAYARSFTDGAEIFFGGMEDHWNVPACHFDPSGRYDTLSPYIPQPWTSNEVRHKQCDHVTPGKHSSELFADASIDFLEHYDADDPFFMYVSFMAPHDPRSMPKAFLDLYDPEQIPLPPNFMGGHPFDNGELKIRDEVLAGFPRSPEEVRRHIAEYYAMISHLDAQMARVMDALEKSGKAENTLIVLAGDNGLALGQHGLMGKQSNYDHSVRVPLILAGPGIPEGQTSDAFVYLLDIYPTLCELIGAPLPASVEGTSFVPALRDGATGGRDTLFFAYTNLHRAVRNDRFKLIEYVVKGRRTTQLFDLLDDPWELHNLADLPEHQPTRERLSRELLRWRDEWDDTATPWGKTFWAGHDAANTA